MRLVVRCCSFEEDCSRTMIWLASCARGEALRARGGEAQGGEERTACESGSGMPALVRLRSQAWKNLPFW